MSPGDAGNAMYQVGPARQSKTERHTDTAGFNGTLTGLPALLPPSE